MSEYRQRDSGSHSESRTLSSIFLDAEHQSRFNQHLSQLSAHQQASSEYQSALFILTSTEELYKKHTKISRTNQGIGLSYYFFIVEVKWRSSVA